MKLVYIVTFTVFSLASLFGQTDLKGVISVKEGMEIPKEGVHVHVLGVDKGDFTQQDGK